MKGERVKKTILLAVVALVTAIVPSLAGAADNDVNGPKCADVTSGSLFYTGANNARAILNLAGPSCSFVTYTLVVLDSEGGAELARVALNGDGTPQIRLATIVSGDADNTICAYVETSVGKHVFDRGPDEGCGVLTLDPSAPGYGFN